MDLKTVKQGLEKRKKELLDREGRLQSDIRRESGSLSEDSEERAVEKENDEVLDALDVTVRAELQQVDNAIERIEKGLYFNCAKCGAEIAEDRLVAIPFTDTCIKCV